MTLIPGRVVATLATPDKSSLLTTATDGLVLDLDGVPGDRHWGRTRAAGPREPWLPRGLVMRHDRQLSALCPDELARIAAALTLESLLPGLLGANLVIAGLADFSRIAPGSRLAFGGAWRGAGRFDGTAILRVEAYNRPCRGPGRQIAAANPGRPDLEFAFVKAARTLRGLVLSVDCPGRIALGDDVVLVPPLVAP